MGMENGRSHRKRQESGSETPVLVEEEVAAAVDLPVKKKEKEREREKEREKEKDRERRHRHHRHHHRHHHGKDREKERSSREKRHHHRQSSRGEEGQRRRSPEGIVGGGEEAGMDDFVTVPISEPSSSVPLFPTVDVELDVVDDGDGIAVGKAVVEEEENLVVMQSSVALITQEADRESGEIEEGEIRDEGGVVEGGDTDVDADALMDIHGGLENASSMPSKKRKYELIVEEFDEKNTHTRISSKLNDVESVAPLAIDDSDDIFADKGHEKLSSQSRKFSHSYKSSRWYNTHDDDEEGGNGHRRRSRSRDRVSTKKSRESEALKSLPKEKSVHADPKKRSLVSVENSEKKRKSMSPERKVEDDHHERKVFASPNSNSKDDHQRVHKGDKRHQEGTRRSPSRDSLMVGSKADEEGRKHHKRDDMEQVKNRADYKDKQRPRSSSRSRDGRGVSMERRRRSRSRDSARGLKLVEDYYSEKKVRSRSRESVRDREREVLDSRRNVSIRPDDSNTSRGTRSRNDYESGSRHRRGEDSHDRSMMDNYRENHLDSSERKRRSRSRDSGRERRGVSRSRGNADDHHQIRHGGHYDGQVGRNGNVHSSAGRDRVYGSDRHVDRDWDTSRDGGYGSRQTRDRGDRSYVSRSSRDEAKHAKEERAREEDDEEDYQERIESQLAAQEEDDVERIKEESRRRRQAILDKYKQQQTKVDAEKPASLAEAENYIGSGEVGRHATSPLEHKEDKQEEEQPERLVSVSLEKGDLLNGEQQSLTGIGGLGQGSPKSEHSADMFTDDIFGESPAGGRRVGKGDGLAIDTSGLTDNWDDAEGRYCFRIGEVLDGRYEVLSAHGSGVFSTVVRARDMKAGRNDPDEVAIKIIRNNETMFRTGQQELVILKKLAGADPENRRHCVRLLSSFEYRHHLCLVFESLHMNLREILKKFGRNIGINLTAVRAYAKQLFIALKHLKNCGVLHCDIKPDNMLVNDAKNVLKLCDFGSAMFAGENEITPYLVSRFYRAPEIILGLPYDHALDVWSVGCCLYELYSGKMLFPGHTNNDMLRLHMELKGPFPKKMLKKAQFTDQHFDQDYNFCAVEEDLVTKKMVKRIVINVKPKDMGVLVNSSGTLDEDSRIVGQFKDMLEKIFTLDPDKRMTVSQALNHPFISGK